MKKREMISRPATILANFFGLPKQFTSYRGSIHKLVIRRTFRKAAYCQAGLATPRRYGSHLSAAHQRKDVPYLRVRAVARKAPPKILERAVNCDPSIVFQPFGVSKVLRSRFAGFKVCPHATICRIVIIIFHAYHGLVSI